MAKLGEQLLQPENGWRRYDGNDIKILCSDTKLSTSDSNCYNGTYNYCKSGNFNFSFYGTKIRFINTTNVSVYRCDSINVYIDGVLIGSYTEVASSILYQRMLYEVNNLSLGLHTVTLIGVNMSPYNVLGMDAIDIDDTGYLIHPILNQVSDINTMQVGDCIPCRYTAHIDGQAGTFSELGTCIADEIPLMGTRTPNGLFYLIKVDKGILIADRVIQTNISWDVLNSAKYIEGYDISTFKNIIPHGNQANRVIKVSDTEVTLYSKSGAHNGAGIQSKISPFSASGVVTIEYSYYPTNFYSSAMNQYFALLRKSQLEQFESTYGSPYPNIAIVSLNYTSLTQNTWHAMKVVLDFNTNIFKFYYDGTLYNTLPLSDIVADEDLFFDIGAGYYGGVNNDRIKDIKITKEGNSSNFIFKGSNVLIRSLSGGCAYADSKGNSSFIDKKLGAWPINNEWDKYILNSDLKGKVIKGDDKIWNYNVSPSWCKETPINGRWYTTSDYGVDKKEERRIIRGMNTAPSWENINYEKSTDSSYEGFRPVLNYVEDDIKDQFIY